VAIAPPMGMIIRVRTRSFFWNLKLTTANKESGVPVTLPEIYRREIM